MDEMVGSLQLHSTHERYHGNLVSSGVLNVLDHPSVLLLTEPEPLVW